MSFVKDIWEAVVDPIETLFTRPKDLWNPYSHMKDDPSQYANSPAFENRGSEWREGNWIADWAVPAAIGVGGSMIGGPAVGAGLATAYGAWGGGGYGAPGNYSTMDYVGGAARGYTAGMLGSAMTGAGAAAGGGGAANQLGYEGAAAGMGMGGAGTGTAAGSAATFGGANVGLGGAAAAGISGAGTAMQNYGVNSMLSPKPTFETAGGTSKGFMGFGGGGSGAAEASLKTTGVAGGTGGGAGGGTDFMSKLTNPMTIMGAAGLTMAQLGTTATPPNVGATASKWLTSDAVTRAGKLAREMVETEYLNPWEPDNEIQAFMEVQEKDIRKRFKYRSEEMDKMGLSSNEQFMHSGERLEMHRRLGDQEEHEISLMRQDWLLTAKRQYSVNQYNYIMKELQADDSTKQNLLYADIADVMWNYNMEREEVLNFRKIASDAGMYLLGQGMGIQ